MMTAPLSSLDLDDTRKAFDAAAGVYDVAYEDLPGIRRFRMLTREIYLRFFPLRARFSISTAEPAMIRSISPDEVSTFSEPTSRAE